MDTDRRILGITAEYDPFHRGHAWQLQRARTLVNPEAVVCVMSGSFTQRGEPAVLDKWTRARIAVEQGVDLVFELPFSYACSRAQRFAAGAVDLLAAAGVTHISFGCEADRPEDLQKLADGQMEREDQIRDATREFMKSGFSRAKAAELACRDLFGKELTDLMLTPNNILALEYLKRIRRQEERSGVMLQPVPVRRHGSGYGTEDARSGFAGGSILRRMLAEGQDIAAYLPYDPTEIRWADLPEVRRRLYAHLRSILLRSTPEEIAEIYCVGEGMEHRLLREARRQTSYEGFLSAMVSRRYTAAAIRRIMTYILMNVTELPASDPYGRVLAASSEGRRLLRRLEDCRKKDIHRDAAKDMERSRPIPLAVIANGNRLQGLPASAREVLQLDARAADMYNLLCGRSVEEESDRRKQPWMKMEDGNSQASDTRAEAK